MGGGSKSRAIGERKIICPVWIIIYARTTEGVSFQLKILCLVEGPVSQVVSQQDFSSHTYGLVNLKMKGKMQNCTTQFGFRDGLAGFGELWQKINHGFNWLKNIDWPQSLISRDSIFHYRYHRNLNRKTASLS